MVTVDPHRGVAVDAVEPDGDPPARIGAYADKGVGGSNPISTGPVYVPSIIIIGHGHGVGSLSLETPIVGLVPGSGGLKGRHGPRFGGARKGKLPLEDAVIQATIRQLGPGIPQVGVHTGILRRSHVR